MLVTTPLALTGGAAPALWLIVARAGGLLALAGAAALAARLGGGRAGGAAAAAIVAFGPWWAYNTALGNSEGTARPRRCCGPSSPTWPATRERRLLSPPSPR